MAGGGALRLTAAAMIYVYTKYTKAKHSIDILSHVLLRSHALAN